MFGIPFDISCLQANQSSGLIYAKNNTAQIISIINQYQELAKTLYGLSNSSSVNF